MKLFMVLLMIVDIILTNKSLPDVACEEWKQAEDGQFPFMASLRTRKVNFCGASIISKQWLLTAAHCLEMIEKRTRVLVGTTSQRRGGVQHKIDRWIRHEQFSKENRFPRNDIGLVKIQDEFEFSESVRPVKLGRARIGEDYTVAGWGETEVAYYSKTLLFIEERSTNGSVCEGFYDGFEMVVGVEQVCTLSWTKCRGDGGAPLISHRDRLVGIFSLGIMECGKNIPNVYTSPASYLCWIQEKTWLTPLYLLKHEDPY